MLIFVVAFNSCLSILNICAIVLIWKAFRKLRSFNQNLNEVQISLEKSRTHNPKVLTIKGYQLEQIKGAYEQLIKQINLSQQIIFLITLKFRTKFKLRLFS